MCALDWAFGTWSRDLDFKFYFLQSSREIYCCKKKQSTIKSSFSCKIPVKGPWRVFITPVLTPRDNANKHNAVCYFIFRHWLRVVEESGDYRCWPHLGDLSNPRIGSPCRPSHASIDASIDILRSLGESNQPVSQDLVFEPLQLQNLGDAEITIIAWRVQKLDRGWLGGLIHQTHICRTCAEF